MDGVAGRISLRCTEPRSGQLSPQNRLLSLYRAYLMNINNGRWQVHTTEPSRNLLVAAKGVFGRRIAKPVAQYLQGMVDSDDGRIDG